MTGPNYSIMVADITSAIDAIEKHAFSANTDEASERGAALFVVLEEVRNIRAILSRRPADLPAEKPSALASKARPS